MRLTGNQSINGLGGRFFTGWQRQTLHFGHEHGDKYSFLLIDNRGIGDSDVPLMRYSTTDMAYDVAEVLVDVGWIPSEALPVPRSAATPALFDDPDFEGPASERRRDAAGLEHRRVHVLGVSLGGMIAQELGMLIPHAISTLSLCCTAAWLVNTTTWTEHMLARLSIIVPQGLEKSLRVQQMRNHPTEWLEAQDDVHLPEVDPANGVEQPVALPGVLPAWTKGIVPSPEGPKRITVQDDAVNTDVSDRYELFPTNYYRVAAQEMTKRLDPSRFPTKGFFAQMIAAGWHSKTPAQLRQLGDMVGRERILVMHGTADGMITVPHGETLIALLEPGVGLIEDGMGHSPMVHRWKWFNELLEARFAVGERLDGRA
jgi:pimeloyl-ACP methyl ester carboxylesterase